MARKRPQVEPRIGGGLARMTVIVCYRSDHPMASDSANPTYLAPVQRIMLADSLANPGTGCHVEQMEIAFARQVKSEQIISAWWETVGKTEALRISFLIEDGNPAGWETAGEVSILEIQGDPPESWETWLDQGRHRELLVPGTTPWRCVLWESERRFVWTFHHALLDGRSITRILKTFLDRVSGGAGEALALAKWQPPNQDMKMLGDAMFTEIFDDVGRSNLEPLVTSNESRAIRCLGSEFLCRLQSKASLAEVSIATFLIWAWGQAVAQASECESVVVEQVRSGAPQEGTAGFTMTLLPLRIQRGGRETLSDLPGQLQALRKIETLSVEDFSPGVFPDVNGPWSSVIMVERGRLGHQLGGPECIESLTLHEPRGESLMASAHILPDLRLEVEGPGRHELLAAWIEVLER